MRRLIIHQPLRRHGVGHGQPHPRGAHRTQRLGGLARHALSSADGVNPKPLGIGSFSKMGFSAEHTTIELDAPAAKPAIGDKLEFIVGYGDTTVHLHDVLYGVRGDIVEAEWPIVARGKLA